MSDVSLKCFTESSRNAVEGLKEGELLSPLGRGCRAHVQFSENATRDCHSA